MENYDFKAKKVVGYFPSLAMEWIAKKRTKGRILRSSELYILLLHIVVAVFASSRGVLEAY